MRPKVIIAVRGALVLLAIGTYFYLTSPVLAPGEAQPSKQSVVLEVIEPREAFAKEFKDRLEITGKLQWILVNPSYKDGLLSVAIKTSEDWDILLGKWDTSQCLELKLTHTHPSPHVRVAASDYLARHGPFRLNGDIASITVRNKENRDHNGFGVIVQMTSGQHFSASAALAGAVIIEFFYN